MSAEDVKAAGITSGVMLSYLLFYSGYDKATKQIHLKKVGEIVFVEKGWLYTVQQVNKVLGLGGLTLAGLGMVPWKAVDGCQKQLVAAAVALVSVHAGMSEYLFYKFNPKTMLTGQGKNVRFEVPALLMGVLGYYGITDALLKGNVRSPTAYASLLLALLHFYFIETPTGLPQDLPCRPYAYTAVATSITALNGFGWSNLLNYFKGFF